MLHFADIDDELDCNAHFGSMTFVDPINDNYTIKLVLAQRAEKPGPKPKVHGAKIAPKIAPVFDVKFRIS